jgi:phosphoribosylformimino-5-aminoimidazole carboxamide ribonucleotide (ProFAR) isomerase
VIVPCIDLQHGRAVQLVHGRTRRLAVRDVYSLLDCFRAYSRLHLIDLDAALRRGSNGRLLRDLCRRATKQGMKVRVGGGVRSVARAKRIVGWGAEKVIIGSAAFRHGRVNHAFLGRLVAAIGRKRVILALDTEFGHIVVRGWRERLKLRPEDALRECERYASGFLCTYVDNEGSMRGTNLAWYRELRRGTQLPITAAGGIRSRREVTILDRLEIDAAVGMAMYLGKLR